MLRFLTAGESHGPLLTGILDGIPAGLPLSQEVIDAQLVRRQRGFGSGPRMKLERDRVAITGGVLAGRTTGGPIALSLPNLDHPRWLDRELVPMTVPRPGHADLAGALKYGHRELRLSLERASARETAMRVALGAVCRALLAELQVEVLGYVVRIGEVALPADTQAPDRAAYRLRARAAEDSPVRCYDPSAAAAMSAAIDATIRARDTIGGVVEVVALGVPPGLGSFAQADRRLSARLAAALMSVPATRGVELGAGFASAAWPGTAAQDAYYPAGPGDDSLADSLAAGLPGSLGDGFDPDAIVTRTNHAGGIEGGISTSAPIVARVACKPIATTLVPQPSVDLATGRAASARYERSDFCQVPRAVPIFEAVLCFVLAEALCEKLGGDSLDEMRPRLSSLRRLRWPDLPVTNQPWRPWPAPDDQTAAGATDAAPKGADAP
ncbi:MAG: chorismate synthase [Polyangia bacterium]